MTVNRYKLIVEAIVQDRASANLRKVGRAARQTSKSVNKLDSSFKNLAGAFTAIMVASKLKDALESIISPALELNMTFKKLEALTQATGREMLIFQEAAFKAAETSIYGPQAATEAMLKLRQATGDTNAAVTALQPTLGLAMASFGKLTPERAARMSSDLIKSFGMRAEETAPAMDKLYVVTRRLGLEIQGFEKIMGRMGQAALIGGQSYDEMLIAMSLAARAAPSTLRASRQMLGTMSELTTKGADGLKRLGIETVDAISGKVKPMSEILVQLSQRWMENQANVRSVLTANFGRGAVQPLLTAISAMSKGLVDGQGKVHTAAAAYEMLKNEAGGSAGALEKMRKEIMKTPAGKVMLLNEAWTNIKITLGNTLLPAVLNLATAVKNFLDGWRKFFNTGPGKFVAKWGMLIGTVVTAVLALRMAIWGVRGIWNVTVANVVQGSTTYVMATDRMTAATGRLAGVMQTLKSRVGFLNSKTGGMVKMAGWAAIIYGITEAAGGLSRSFDNLRESGNSTKVLAANFKKLKSEIKMMDAWSSGEMSFTDRIVKPIGDSIQRTQIIARESSKVFNETRSSFQSLKKQALWFSQWNVKMLSLGYADAGDDLADRLKKRAEVQQVIADAAKATKTHMEFVKKMMADGGRELYSWMSLGSENVGKVLDRVEKIVNHRAPEIDAGMLRGLAQKVAGARTTTPQQAAYKARAMQTLPKLYAGLQKMAAGKMEMPEYMALVDQVKGMTTSITMLQQLGALGVGDKQYKNMLKNTIIPFLKMGSRENAEFTTPLVQALGGRNPAGTDPNPMEGYNLLQGKFLTHGERQQITGSKQQQNDMWGLMSGEGMSSVPEDSPGYPHSKAAADKRYNELANDRYKQLSKLESIDRGIATLIDRVSEQTENRTFDRG